MCDAQRLSGKAIRVGIREFQTCTFLMFGNSESWKVGSSDLLPPEQGPFPLEKMDLWDGDVDFVINSCKIRTKVI